MQEPFGGNGLFCRNKQAIQRQELDGIDAGLDQVCDDGVVGESGPCACTGP